MTVAFTKCPTCGSNKRWGSERRLAARTSLCSRNAHDETVLILGKERVSARSGGRARMWPQSGLPWLRDLRVTRIEHNSLEGTWWMWASDPTVVEALSRL